MGFGHLPVGEGATEFWLRAGNLLAGAIDFVLHPVHDAGKLSQGFSSIRAEGFDKLSLTEDFSQ